MKKIVNLARDAVWISGLILFGLWLLGCCCNAQTQGITDTKAESALQMQAASIIAPVVESAQIQLKATADLAENQIKNSQQAGRDAISKVNTGTPWYANLIGFVGVLFWQWKMGYRPANWEAKAQYARRNGNDSR